MQNAIAAMRQEPTDPHSPWNDRTGWRLGRRAALDLQIASQSSTTAVRVQWRSDGYEMIIGSQAYRVSGVIGASGEFSARVLDEQVHGVVAFDEERLTLIIDDEDFNFTVVDPARPQISREDRAGLLSAPMPGRVVAVMTEVGADVERETPLVVIEAMKMEHTITAPRSGRIKAVRVAPGDQVAAGVEVIVMEDER
jgi:3-methylcrotonyl-CoA carboxylase alpha subunit